MTELPAVLDGTPAFPELLPLVQPTLPQWDQGLAHDVEQLLVTGMLTKGVQLQEMEARMAEHLDVRYAIGVASCTLGLLLTFQALGLSGEVIVPSFTFMATAHPLHLLGIEPVFVDIDPETWNIDVAAVERAITPRTTAIVAVHVFGNPAPVAELEALAKARELRLVFDAAHGFGAQYRGRPVGPFGDAEVFSMSPTKLLVAGEGGIVATNDDDVADKLRLGREYGNRGSYDSEFAGLNARLAEFNAILALRNLETLEEAAETRTRLVAQFTERLKVLPGIRFQRVHPQDRSSYKDFSIWLDEELFGLSRDELALALKAEKIDTRSYYDPPLHRHQTYRHLMKRYQESLPVTDAIAHGALSLPIWSHMPPETVHRICDALIRIQQHAPLVREALPTRSA